MILGANNLVAEVQCVALSVPVTCGKLHFHHHFCILLLSQSGIVIFGHDKLKRFGLEISGIPINIPSASLSLPDNSNVMTSKQYHEKSLPPSKQQYLLDVNQQLPFGPSSPLHQAYSLPHAYHAAIDEQIESWAKHQVIIPTTDDCPWNSPILAIPKKDASGQLTEVHGCINPWAINSVLMDDIYPIPSILDIVKHVANQPKLTFTWKGKHWMFRGAPFGIKTVPLCMQHLITVILNKLHDCSAYHINDYLVHTKWHHNALSQEASSCWIRPGPSALLSFVSSILPFSLFPFLSVYFEATSEIHSLIQIPSCAAHIMEASAALDTLREQLRKAQQEYLHMLQQSFQLELNIPSCPETERVAKEEEQRKLDEAAEHTRKAMERLQQRIDNFVVFLASTSATLGNSSTCNTTAAAVSPPSPVPQISPIQSPRLSSPSPVDVSVNNTTASNSTHVPSVPETQSNATTPSPPTQKKMPRLPPGLPKFDISKRQDPALHTMELEYHLNAYNYPEDRWTQALITTLVGDGRLWAISALRDQPWNIARDLFHQHYRLPDIEATTIEAVTSFQQKPGESVHQLINQYSVLCNHLPDTFYDYLKAFFFGRALLPHIEVQATDSSQQATRHHRCFQARSPH
ncbi:hypothetical protein QOT17_022269 [Balamuthia mandrillaris]